MSLREDENASGILMTISIYGRLGYVKPGRYYYKE